MERILECECGHVVRSSSEEDLVGRVQEHAGDAHSMEISREQILALARPVIEADHPASDRTGKGESR